MSNVGPEGRSFLTIVNDDLHRLAAIAKKDREDFFADHPDWSKHYKNRFICSALCQGAGMHYVSPSSGVGINDFDVYSFYSSNPNKRWYAKRLKQYDFGSPKFGQTIDRPMFIGRRVDILGRSLPDPVDCDPLTALQKYLAGGLSETARFLAMKGVVLIEPTSLLGTVVWPQNV